MTDDESTQLEAPDRAALDALITEEAARQGFVDGADVVALLDRSRLEHDASGRPTNVAKLVTALRRDRPYLLAVRGDGTPEVLASTSVHGAGSGERRKLEDPPPAAGDRPRDADGKFVPDMNDAFRALFGPETDEAGVARLTRLTTHPAGAGPAPTQEELDEATRTMLPGTRGGSDHA